MNENAPLHVIARIRSDFTTKFGIPRQSCLVEMQKAIIIFEPEYRDINALRGLDGFSYIWLIWGFSQTARDTWSPMVKPPRLGGKMRMGVFATRSPFRPNSIGLSSVRLEGMEPRGNLGTVLHISGADLMDGTPIYDIKPYLSFTDSHPDAVNGFAGDCCERALEVVFDDKWLRLIPLDKQEALIASLKQDPRPAYQNDPDMPYGFEFAGFDVRFKVNGAVLTVYEVVVL
ncbi:MAG: tRNA (N6-threonylcarbamoyladenosine(37)-N6)-methyltransferase TrmO [Clostridia bacterium]